MRKIVGIFASVLIGALIVVQIIRLGGHLRDGQQLRRSGQKFEQHPTNPIAHIVLVGDSVAFGLGATSPDQSIAGRLGQYYLHGDVTNLGVVGAETKDIPAQIAAIHQRVDIIIIIVGANDVVHFANLQQSGKILDGVIAQAAMKADQVIVMPEGNIGNAPIFPRWAAEIFERRSRQLRTIFMSIAVHRQATYVDIFFERKDDRWRKDVAKFYAADFFHPTDAGYQDWAQAILAVVKPLPR